MICSTTAVSQLSVLAATNSLPRSNLLWTKRGVKGLLPTLARTSELSLSFLTTQWTKQQRRGAFPTLARTSGLTLSRDLLPALEGLFPTLARTGELLPQHTRHLRAGH